MLATYSCNQRANGRTPPSATSGVTDNRQVTDVDGQVRIAAPPVAPLAPVVSFRAALSAALELVAEAMPSGVIRSRQPSIWGPGWNDAGRSGTPLSSTWTTLRERYVLGLTEALASLDAAEADGALVGRRLGWRLHQLVVAALARHGVVRLAPARYRLPIRPVLLVPRLVSHIPDGLEEARAALLSACRGRLYQPPTPHFRGLAA